MVKKLFEREYYKIATVAASIDATMDDFIHWAATGQLYLGVLFSIDGWNLNHYTVYSDDTLSQEQPVEEFTGFAYVERGYFQDMELSGGDLQFNSVRMLDGQIVLKGPFDENYGVERRSIEQIYIHAKDLNRILSTGARANESKSLSTTERNTLLVIIAALCDYSAINLQERGVAMQIARLTEELGAAVSDDTVRRLLGKVPEALESRAK